MLFDICPNCDGTGERDFLSGARCYYCDGTGMIEDTLEDYDDLDEDDDEHGTASYEQDETTSSNNDTTENQ